MENYDFRSDFQILNLKEKRKVLKNAKRLLKLQKDNAIAEVPVPPNEKI